MSQLEGTRGAREGGGFRGVTFSAALLTSAEWWSVGFSIVTLVLLEYAVAPEFATGAPSAQLELIFVPHLVLVGLIIGGLRRAAAVLQGFVLVLGALMALGLTIDAAMGHHAPRGYALTATLQLPLFVLCYRNGTMPFSYRDLPLLGPRIALGTLVAVVGWFAAGFATYAAAAPARARDAAILAGKRREAAKREAYARTDLLTACLQQSPATDDSLPYFPATLGELAAARCPEARLAAPEGFVIEYTAGVADTTGRHRSFHLVIRDSIASDSSHTFDSDESMIVRSFVGQGKRRYPSFSPQPMEMLSQVGRCIEQARDTLTAPGTTSYPVSAADARLRCQIRLKGDSSAFREGGNRATFVVHYSPPPTLRANGAPGGYTLLLEPSRDASGRGMGGALVSLLSDSAGLIHMTRRPRAATIEDPVIPDCVSSTYTGLNPRAPCKEYRPRQRWGLTSEVPSIALSMSGGGTLGIGEKFTLLPHYRPIGPQDAPTDVRVRWDSGGRDTVLTRRRGVPFGTPLGEAVYFTFRHTWADTGMKHITVRVRTVAGEEYTAGHDIHVVPRR